MDLEDIKKKFANPFSEQAEFIDEMVEKGITGDELIEAYTKKFIDLDEVYDELIKDSKDFEEAGDFEEAIKCVEDALEIRPDDFHVLKYKKKLSEKRKTYPSNDINGDYFAKVGSGKDPKSRKNKTDDLGINGIDDNDVLGTIE